MKKETKIMEGMFVRYTTGNSIEKIAKIKEIVPPEFPIWEEYYRFDNGDGAIPNVIIKASHNIIDLIEVGDYVNGYEVIQIDNGRLYFDVGDFSPNGIENNQIKLIVTKQQFESSMYEVK